MTSPPTIRRSTETIKITVPLTPADHEELHAKQIEHDDERVRLETKIDDYKGAIKAAQKAVDTLNGHIYASIAVLRKGEKTVDLECWKVTDYEAGLVRHVSKETNDVVKERLLTDDERQMAMDFDGDDDDGEDVTVIGAESSPDAHPDDQGGAQSLPCGQSQDIAVPGDLDPTPPDDRSADASASGNQPSPPPPAGPLPTALPGPLAAAREPLPFKPLKGKAPQKRSTAHA